MQVSGEKLYICMDVAFKAAAPPSTNKASRVRSRCGAIDLVFSRHIRSGWVAVHYCCWVRN